MPSAKNRMSAMHLAVLCVCLVLVFAVFGWGLHAKLSLYHPHVVPSAATVAKLVTGQKLGRELVSWEASVPSEDLLRSMLALIAALLVLPLIRLLWLVPSDLRNAAKDILLDLRLYCRPPPAIRLAR